MRRSKEGLVAQSKPTVFTTRQIVVTLLVVSALSACSEDKRDNNESDGNSQTLVAFDPDGKLEAKINWTNYGVPHIEADNLESLAYGNAYAYARDNYCTLAEQIVKIKSERSKYFGPDRVQGSGDSEYLISDFGYKALELVDAATQHYPAMSDTTRAILEGYSTGLNQYLDDTGSTKLPSQCASAQWLSNITAQELAAYYQALNLQTSTIQYLGLAFYANPDDGDEYLPYTVTADATNSVGSEKFMNTTIASDSFRLPIKNKSSLGSNAWALGSTHTENEKGALLGNPHFPMVGNLRFWQSHLIIPGALNVTGGALQGFPLVQMGFNEDVAWSHTVSNSDHAVLYELSLTDTDRLHYSVDDLEHSITKRTFNIEVNIGDNELVTVAKDYYYSHHGLILEAPPGQVPLGWNDSTAFTLRNAIADNWDTIDHWLAIIRSSNLSDFQDSFRTYDGTAFVNTLYADREGNAFYINNSNVFSFKDNALELMRNDPELVAVRDAFEIYILPGETSLFEPDGINTYDQSPKLTRTDFVQNSNGNYWATNPLAPLSSYSIVYGREYGPLSLRTRMSLTLLSDAGGPDAKFSMGEIEEALHSNRTILGELVLSDLLSQCGSQGSQPVSLDNGLSVNIAKACQALASWDGVMNKDSAGAHLFREFAFKFNPFTQLSQPFDATDPINTPNTLSTDDSVLKSFAAAVANLDQAEIEYSQTLGQLQFFEKSIENGTGSGDRFPWAGPMEAEGGFNIYVATSNSDSVFESHEYEPVLDVETGEPMWSGLSSEGYQIRYGATWLFVVSFSDAGPEGRGLLTSSQSSDRESPHFDDQSQYYSESGLLRKIHFTEADIEEHSIEIMHVVSN